MVRAWLVNGAIAASLLVVLPASARANTIRVAFSGVFTETESEEPGLLPDPIEVGATFQGEYALSTNPPGPPDERIVRGRSIWWFPVDDRSSIAIRVGSLGLQTDPTRVSLANDYRRGFEPPYDLWTLRFAGIPEYAGPDRGASIGLRFIDGTAAAFSDPTSYLVSTSLEPWTTSAIVTVRFSAYGGDRVAWAYGDITSLTVVPEPGAALLLGIGLAALTRIRR